MGKKIDNTGATEEVAPVTLSEVAPVTLEEALAIIADKNKVIEGREKEITELKEEIISQNELIAEMGTTIEGYDAKIAALKYKASIGDTTVEVEFEGKTYAVKNAIRLAGKVVKPTDVADNVELYVPKILALGDQLTLVEVTKEKEEA